MPDDVDKAEILWNWIKIKIVMCFYLQKELNKVTVPKCVDY